MQKSTKVELERGVDTDLLTNCKLSPKREKIKN